MNARIDLFRLPVVALLLALCSSTYAQRSIDCDAPPGGRIYCETRQAAFCKVESGQVTGVCETPRGRTRGEMEAWALSIIFGRMIDIKELSENSELQDIARRHQATIGATHAQIRYSLPGENNSSELPKPLGPTQPTAPKQPTDSLPTDPLKRVTPKPKGQHMNRSVKR